jgi:UDP-N-acetylmuramate dehydrogenase
MIDRLRERISIEVKENESLARYTTYQIGGSADYFFAATTADDAIKALQVAEEVGLPYFVLGGGSNVLISDGGFRGLVIKMDNRGIKFIGTKVQVEAGTPTALIALKTTEAGLAGFEWAIGLPGTIGGAIRGNAGMQGGEMAQAVEGVRCFHGDQEEVLTREQCLFAYRDSIFKQQPGRIILSATLSLQMSADPTSSKQRLQEVLNLKKHQQPIEYPTAGCIFKNWLPESADDLTRLRRWLDLNPEEKVPVTTNGTIPAGWIIDRAQLKEMKIGGAMISTKHANFFINTGNATAHDVIELIAIVKTRVRNLTHGVVHLQEEIEYVGF